MLKAQGLSITQVCKDMRIGDGAVRRYALQSYKGERLPVSAVVVNFNGGALLVDCVAVLLMQAAQVIVVDNHSTDLSMEGLETHFGSNQQLLKIFVNTNNGFAAGCNIGLLAATHASILFINPDCVLGSEALAKLLAVLNSSPDVGMVGGLLTNPDGSEQGGGRRGVPTPWRSFVRAFGLTRLSVRWPKLFFDFYLHNQPLPQKPIEVEAISGALMLVKRSAVDRVGMWDEAYFLHCEDLDWCMRFRGSGLRILFVPDAPVVHYQGGCSRSRPLFVEWHKHRGMVLFYRKFFRHQYPGGLMWLVKLGVWFRFGLVAVRHGLQRVLQQLKGKS